MRRTTPGLPALLKVFGLVIVVSLVSEIFAEKSKPIPKKSITETLENTQQQIDQVESQLVSLRVKRTNSPAVAALFNEAEHTLLHLKTVRDLTVKKNELYELGIKAMQTLLSITQDILPYMFSCKGANAKATAKLAQKNSNELKNAMAEAGKAIDSENIQKIQQSIDNINNALKKFDTSGQELLNICSFR